LGYILGDFSQTRLATLGSMLWSQFSAILDNFRRKNLRFSQKPLLWSKFCINYLCFESKTPIFCWIFRRKYFRNHNIGPWSRGMSMFLKRQMPLPDRRQSGPCFSQSRLACGGRRTRSEPRFPGKGKGRVKEPILRFLNLQLQRQRCSRPESF
jgi:hypothetical protein